MTPMAVVTVTLFLFLILAPAFAAFLFERQVYRRHNARVLTFQAHVKTQGWTEHRHTDAA